MSARDPLKQIGDYPWYTRWAVVMISLVGLTCSTAVFGAFPFHLTPTVVLIKVTALASMWVFSAAFLSTAFYKNEAMAALSKHPLTVLCVLIWAVGGLSFVCAAIVLIQ